MERLAIKITTGLQAKIRGTALLLVGIFVLIVFFLPILNLILYPFVKNGSASGTHLVLAVLKSELFESTVQTTITVAVLASLSSTLLGLVVAFALYCIRDRRLESLFLATLIAAYSTLTIIRTIAIQITLSPDNVIAVVIAKLLGVQSMSLRLDSSLSGLLIGLLHFLLPASIIYVYVGFRRIPINIIRASRILSVSSTRAALLVFWPALRMRLLYLTFINFLLCLGAFVTPSILGGAAGEMISNVINERMRTSDALDQALLLGGVFSMACFIVVTAFGILCRGALTSDVQYSKPS
jgi:ABC-type spermidine/putrescine transport system permease subunit I